MVERVQEARAGLYILHDRAQKRYLAISHNTLRASLMRLRFATADDIPQLVALINAAYVAESFFVRGERISADALRERMQQSDSRLIVVCDDASSEPQGCVCVRSHDGVAALSLLAVHPDAQHRGIGRYLVRAVEAHAQAVGCDVVELEVFNVRHDLLPFYTSCGYAAVGTREFSAPELLLSPAHLLVMRKSLEAQPIPPDALHIGAATPSDLQAIHAAYRHGRTMQLALSNVAWPGFTDEQIVREMELGHLYAIRQHKIVIGIFSMIEDDSLLWESLECGAHLYLHRITRAPEYDGTGLFDVLVRWAHRECLRRGRVGLRMDTWASNETLLRYYRSRGFALIGVKRIPADERLSPHYHGIELALLEAETMPMAPA